MSGTESPKVLYVIDFEKLNNHTNTNFKKLWVKKACEMRF